MEEMCRLCLRSSSTLRPLHSISSLTYKIQAISSIEMRESEGYPSNVCEECVKNVNKFYNFQRVIVNNHKDLSERLATLKRTSLSSAEVKTCEKENDIIIYKSNDTGSTSNEDDPTDDPLKIDLVKQNIDQEVKTIIARNLCKKCQICGETFSSRIKLTNHKRTKQEPRGICTCCGRSVRADNLKRHILMHSLGPVECDICHKVVKNKDSLRGHMLIHREQVFTCEYCGKQYKVKAEHKRHLLSHKDPDARKAKCKICGKKVKDMKGHTLSHTGERPYNCQYCSKAFRSTFALKIHTRHHTNERPYTCPHCDASYTQKVSLITHLKSKHNLHSLFTG